MVVAIDFGATNIRVANVVGKSVKNKQKIKTPKTKKQILSALTTLIDKYKPKEAICIALAGFEHKGKTRGTRNMDFKGVPLSSILKKRYKVPVYIQNDANCAGLAEKYYGHGKGKKNFALLTLGTGIGGAVIVNGKLYTGNINAGGEIGRLIVEGRAYEERASGNASVSRGRKEGFPGVTSLELENLCKRGDKKACDVYTRVGHSLGLGLLDIAYLLDPEIIVLGGGFAKVKPIYKEAIKTLHTNDELKRKIPVIHAKLSDDAGLIGAALIPKEFS